MTAWRVAATTAELGRRPLAATVGDLHLVLFRGPDGRPRALEDRCPHRGVPLSLGLCRGGTIECAYHGWRFDGAGTLLAVPSNVDAAMPGARVPAYAAAARDGFVWVAAEPEGEPPDLGLAGFAWRRWRLVDARPVEVVRAALGVRWVAPDRGETGSGDDRLLLLVVPEGPERTRIEVLAGRKAWFTRIRDVAPSPLPVAQPGPMGTSA